MTESNFNSPDMLIPAPIDLERVENTIRTLGFNYLAGSDRFVLPWVNHLVTVFFGAESGLQLTVLAKMRMTLDLSAIHEVAHVLNSWNSERISPTAMLHVSDSGDVEIQFRFALNVDELVSTIQLENFLQLSFDTIDMASNAIIESFSELDFTGTGSEILRIEQNEHNLSEPILKLIVPPTISPAEQESGTMDSTFTPGDDSNFASDSDLPSQVDLPRIQQQLKNIGVEKTNIDKDYLATWINDVFLGFFVDNGPTLLVKGHWDSNMDPERDFVKLFMMCNQWNEDSLTTKAFCHTDAEGLQVRVEFSVPVAAGLTDKQLRHNLALAVHHILQALTSLSTEATGKSVVDWPEST